MNDSWHFSGSFFGVEYFWSGRCLGPALSPVHRPLLVRSWNSDPLINNQIWQTGVTDRFRYSTCERCRLLFMFFCPRIDWHKKDGQESCLPDEQVIKHGVCLFAYHIAIIHSSVWPSAWISQSIPSNSMIAARKKLFISYNTIVVCTWIMELSRGLTCLEQKYLSGDFVESFLAAYSFGFAPATY